ncbi:class E sortase [Yinghuangia soli]|uniref:Class E sortase n=1 Tax=Yinghuangia soli TaxID=2908204 RepID=A0AA41PWW8_9ACTN|nr:class E sortase [Yinghuangia soli]MCF2527365.1 class E sortase [Yinghuangia soli]
MKLRTLIRGFGELFITLSIVMLLFVVFELYWTGVLAREAQADELSKLEKKTEQVQAKAAATGTPAPVAPVVGQPAVETPAVPPPPPYEIGETFAVMYIPRFGKDWDWTVLAGARTEILKKGLGWYEGSAALGADGNFAVAGHRKTYGDPMLDFDKLKVGDKVILRDTMNWYVYTLDQPLVNAANNPGKAVYKTVPSDVGVVAALPESAYDKPGKYITLTTCEPKNGSTHRLIVWGHLESVQPLSAGEPAALKGKK